MSTDGAEAEKQLVVEGSCDIHKGDDNALDLPDTLGVKRRAVFVFGSKLRFCAVENGLVLVREQLGFLGSWVTAPTEDVAYVTVHCEAARADTGTVVPSNIDAGKLLASRILRDVVIFLEDGRGMVGMLFSDIFNTKIINY